MVNTLQPLLDTLQQMLTDTSHKLACETDKEKKNGWKFPPIPQIVKFPIFLNLPQK